MQNMKFKFGALACIMALLFVAGCGNKVAVQDNKQSSGQVSPKAEQKQASAGIVVADAKFSNLQLTKADMPVYDQYTLAERRQKGLTVAFPKLQPYREGKVAYLTFDDGPDTKNTISILDTLKKYNAKATFYVQGQYAKAYSDVIKRIYKEGHAIGNHSYDHNYKKIYASHAAFFAEMEETDKVIKDIIGVRPVIMRAPGGIVGSFTKSFWKHLPSQGYVEHDWNVSSADAAPGHPVAQDFIDNINGQTEDGKKSALILMHCSGGHEETAKALPQIIEILQKKGYSFGVVTPMTPQPW